MNVTNQDIPSLLLFAEVVAAGGFTRAAERLGVPRATISRKIAELERRLGVRLLHRTTRALAPTGTGRTVLALCGQIDTAVQQVNALVGASREEPTGVLRVSIPDTPGGLFLGAWLAEFGLRYPQIRLEILVTDRLLNLIEHRLDAAIRVGPLGDSGLVSQRLATTDRLVCAAPRLAQDWAQRSKESGRFSREPHPHDWTAAPAVAFGEPGSPHAPWSLTQSQGGGVEALKPDWVATVNDMSTLIGLVRGGLGLGLIPRFVAQPLLAQGALVDVLPGWTGPLAPFYLVYPARELLPARLRALIQFLRDRFASAPAWFLN